MAIEASLTMGRETGCSKLSVSDSLSLLSAPHALYGGWVSWRMTTKAQGIGHAAECSSVSRAWQEAFRNSPALFCTQFCVAMLSHLPDSSPDQQNFAFSGGGIHCQSQSQSYITTDSLSVSPSWYQAPTWDLRPVFPILDSFFDSFGFIDEGRPLWREVGSVLFSFCQASPAQPFSDLSPTGLMSIIYCLYIWDSPNQGLFPPGTE
jgi:hypothetical protein